MKGFESFKMPVRVVREMALWTIEVYTAIQTANDIRYIKDAQRSSNAWRRWFTCLGVRELTFSQMQAKIEARLTRHPLYPDSTGAGEIRLSENLLKLSELTADSHITISVHEFSRLAIKPKERK